MANILRQIVAADATKRTSTPAPKKPRRKPGSTAPPTPKKRKETIPTALREAIWIHHMDRVFEGKCRTTWCKNNITVFDFQAGHDQPESKGGPTTFDNLIPICSRCNLSMGNRYTFVEWCKLSNPPVANPMLAEAAAASAPATTSGSHEAPLIPVVTSKGCCSFKR